jgi:hypothetical protein
MSVGNGPEAITMRAIHFLLVFLAAAMPSEARPGQWPLVAPVAESFTFPDASKASVSVTLSSPAGKALYLIECHPLGYESDPDFDYSGDFECRLKSLYSRDRYSTLLTDRGDQSRDWESRGRFLIEELAGSCGDYPEYGRLRHFDVRGMRVTLELTDAVIRLSEAKPTQETRLESFRFRVTVMPNPNAKSAIAAPVKYLPPPFAEPANPKNTSRRCERVLLR